MSMIKDAPAEVKLKRFTTQGYIGLFLDDDIATWFREFTKSFAAEVKQHGELEIKIIVEFILFFIYLYCSYFISLPPSLPLCPSLALYPSLALSPSLSLSGVTVEPHRRQLHITMAHQYLPEHHKTLEDLAMSLVDPTQPAKWEIRLYSRDIRLATSEVSQSQQ